jgi:uncharacterized membrane protein YheB (UPF0754 family)
MSRLKIMQTLADKSLLTNVIAALLIVLGWVIANESVKAIGYFALSGAITNWLAVHMLFEKVPLLYGSGVVPNRFQQFKAGIQHLIMEQFFTAENVSRFFAEGEFDEEIDIDINALLASVDFKQVFQSLVDAIMHSKFGSMLSMVGGEAALAPLEEPVISKLKQALIDIAESDDFKRAIAAHLSKVDIQKILQKVSTIVEKRLNELTPQMVKVIVQSMIKKHLGWLVVWGGVFGGVIGLGVSFL